LDQQQHLLGDQQERQLLRHAMTHSPRFRIKPAQHGLSLVEIAIGLTITSMLMAMAAPSFSDWIRNAHIRSAAESIQSGLAQARSEAVRRNLSVRFQLTDTLDASCVLSTSGRNWVMNLGTANTPASTCDAAPSDTAGAQIIQKVVASSNPNVTIAASQSAVGFDGLGRQIALTSPTTSPSSMTIDISSSQGSCLSAGGAVRCLRLTVSPAGQVRMCDPSMSGTAATSPTAC
jgi:type IV fimbrial biogenesis protein FimT